MAGIERLLRQMHQTAGRRRNLDQSSTGQHIGALAGTVTEYYERPLTGALCGKTVAIDHLRRNFAQRLPVRIEQLRVNLHPTRIDHRTKHSPLPIVNLQNTGFVVLTGHRY